MRIHSDELTYADLTRAAMRARVQFTRITRHGSKKRDHAFDVILSGESRRRQNGGTDYAATWDQWGVFLGHLFGVDPEMTCWAYAHAGVFEYRTMSRFDDGWPDDAHGDHRFRYSGIPCQQSCNKCSAGQRWD